MAASRISPARKNPLSKPSTWARRLIAWAAAKATLFWGLATMPGSWRTTMCMTWYPNRTTKPWDSTGKPSPMRTACRWMELVTKVFSSAMPSEPPTFWKRSEERRVGSDWSSDVCSSDLALGLHGKALADAHGVPVDGVGYEGVQQRDAERAADVLEDVQEAAGHRQLAAGHRVERRSHQRRHHQRQARAAGNLRQHKHGPLRERIKKA